MIWSLELHGFMAAVSVSFLSGMLMDMLLKKLTGSEKVRYVAVLAAAARKGSGTRTSPKSAGANSTSIIPASSISTGT